MRQAPAPDAHLSLWTVIPEGTALRSSIDRIGALPEHLGVMSTLVYERERRSSRVFMRIRVLLAGKNQQGRRFREATETIVINAHGGLVYLGQDLEMGSMLVLTNPFTQDEQECRVVYLGDDSDKGRRVGIEFLTPAPRFWGVEFTHPDWGPGSVHQN